MRSGCVAIIFISASYQLHITNTPGVKLTYLDSDCRFLDCDRRYLDGDLRHVL